MLISKLGCTEFCLDFPWLPDVLVTHGRVAEGQQTAASLPLSPQYLDFNDQTPEERNRAQGVR